MSVLFIVIAVGIVYLLALPHLSAAHTEVSRDQSALLDHKERCVQVLKDLELDFATDKIARDDYEVTRKELERELASLLTKLHAR